MIKKYCSFKFADSYNSLIRLLSSFIIGWFTPAHAQDLGLPLLETTQFELLVTDGGRLDVTIKADQMCQYENGNMTLTGGIAIVLLGHKADKGATHIQADTLSYNKKERLCMIAGKVLVSRPQQKLTMHTDELWYDMKEEIIFTELPIVIADKENVLKGSGLRATRDLSKYTVLCPNGTVEIKQETVPGG